ncbi:MAG TPA: hypothetical protein DF383_13930 [Deltaproteobacteria bacterium]|nr:hypothetical protein [Deltaproteobacteria bacterium]
MSDLQKIGVLDSSAFVDSGAIHQISGFIPSGNTHRVVTRIDGVLNFLHKARDKNCVSDLDLRFVSDADKENGACSSLTVRL